MLDYQAEEPPRIGGGSPPNGYFVLVVPEPAGTGPDVATVLRVLRSGWRTILLSSVIFGVASAAASLALRNEYEASALVAPVASDQGGMGAGLRGQLGGSLGGLAALAGVDLGAGSGAKEQAMATLTSKGFSREFIESQALLPVLFDERLRVVPHGWGGNYDAPSLDDGVKRFTRDVLRIVEDKRSGMVTVRVRWYSPELAAAWANQFVAKANARLRAEAIREAEQNLRYLTRESERTESVEVRRSIYSLIEAQVNSAMLANVRPDYAFKVIDPAHPPDPKNKVAPQRALLAIAGGLLGAILAGLLVLWRQRTSLGGPVAVGRPATQPE